MVPSPPPASPRGLLANLGLLSYALMQLAGQAVDATVLTPCADLISTSVVNPYVWSERIWDSLKSFAPQRARDISRFLSVAIVKSLPVFSTESSSAWSDTAKRLQSHVYNVLSTPQGHTVVQDSVATVIKAAQALGTPEAKEASSQFTATVKSCIQMLATPEGQGMIDDVHNWVCHGVGIATSAETSIFLFEVATHLCHALDADRPSSDAGADDIPAENKASPNTSNGGNGLKNGQGPMGKRRSDRRKAALEESMLRKLGVREPIVEVEEVLELPLAVEVDEQGDAVLARAFESFDDADGESDGCNVVADDIEPWHSDQTHPTLRRRHHRQRLHQAIRTVPPCLR
ncbi:hypothetical protein, variant [Aphanomyces invadans]|uniref:Uncharacterized protein n=1 Tax=Aphanomyces invadans TaxID=157072 RepID=A0A024UMM8_9STRA|nr:hypothetical protein, variant [Aphanomyces invadans]ETW07117.1 hypothetical protein, variant [Aphanomyces invadans]|eukprot:XP_008863210.1 hypothetical protein, variant [Aphanomyces invadans]